MADVYHLHSDHAEADFAAALTAARAGERRGFDALFDLMSRRLHAFARMRSARDPEGLVNDVFLQVFRRLDTFDGDEGAFTGWIFTIARNRLIDEARQAHRRPDELLGEEQAAFSRAGGDAEDDAIARLGSEEVRQLLDELTPDQRDVLLLRVVADLSIADTAAALEKPEGAVKSLQRRALAALAKKISDSPYPAPGSVR